MAQVSLLPHSCSYPSMITAACKNSLIDFIELGLPGLVVASNAVTSRQDRNGTAEVVAYGTCLGVLIFNMKPRCSLYTASCVNYLAGPLTVPWAQMNSRLILRILLTTLNPVLRYGGINVTTAPATTINVIIFQSVGGAEHRNKVNCTKGTCRDIYINAPCCFGYFGKPSVKFVRSSLIPFSMPSKHAETPETERDLFLL